MVNDDLPLGRRRAAHEQLPDRDVPAPAALMAALWAAVSSAHALRGRRSNLFATAPSDVRLGDQLTLLPMVVEWRPASVREAEELTYLLSVYAENSDDGSREESADLAAVFIRSMLEDRAATTPYPPADDGPAVGAAAAEVHPDPARRPPRVPSQRGGLDSAQSASPLVPPAAARADDLSTEIDPLATARAALDQTDLVGPKHQPSVARRVAIRGAFAVLVVAGAIAALLLRT